MDFNSTYNDLECTLCRSQLLADTIFTKTSRRLRERKPAAVPRHPTTASTIASSLAEQRRRDLKQRLAASLKSQPCGERVPVYSTDADLSGYLNAMMNLLRDQ